MEHANPNLDNIVNEIQCQFTELAIENQIFLAALHKKMDRGESIEVRFQNVEYELFKNFDDEFEISINNTSLH